MLPVAGPFPNAPIELFRRSLAGRLLPPGPADLCGNPLPSDGLPVADPGWRLPLLLPEYRVLAASMDARNRAALLFGLGDRPPVAAADAIPPS